jgi:hypothetical protein
LPIRGLAGELYPQHSRNRRGIRTNVPLTCDLGAAVRREIPLLDRIWREVAFCAICEVTKRDADGEYGSYRAHEVSEIHEIVSRRTVTYTAEHDPGALPGWD